MIGQHPCYIGKVPVFGRVVAERAKAAWHHTRLPTKGVEGGAGGEHRMYNQSGLAPFSTSWCTGKTSRPDTTHHLVV